MRPKSTMLESLTAARIQNTGDAPSVTLPEHLACDIGTEGESGSTQPPRGQTGSRDRLAWLTVMIARIGEFGEAGDDIDRPISERVATLRVALENTSAADTAAHDRGFAIQVSKLTKAQVLSLTPPRALLRGNPGNDIQETLTLVRKS